MLTKSVPFLALREVVWLLLSPKLQEKILSNSHLLCSNHWCHVLQIVLKPQCMYMYILTSNLLHTFSSVFFNYYFFFICREIKCLTSHGGRQISLSGNQCCLEHGMVSRNSTVKSYITAHAIIAYKITRYLQDRIIFI